MTRRYSELAELEHFEDRYEYLALNGSVGFETFGHDRYLNQRFYTSWEWRQTRQKVIARDLGCDLGVEGFEIHDKIYIHHMNPMRADDIRHGSSDLFDPEFLISTTHRTHNAIHYGDISLLPILSAERAPGDTRLW